MLFWYKTGWSYLPTYHLLHIIFTPTSVRKWVFNFFSNFICKLNYFLTTLQAQVHSWHCFHCKCSSSQALLQTFGFLHTHNLKHLDIFHSATALSPLPLLTLLPLSTALSPPHQFLQWRQDPRCCQRFSPRHGWIAGTHHSPSTPLESASPCGPPVYVQCVCWCMTSLKWQQELLFCYLEVAARQ